MPTVQVAPHVYRQYVKNDKLYLTPFGLRTMQSRGEIKKPIIVQVMKGNVDKENNDDSRGYVSKIKVTDGDFYTIIYFSKELFNILMKVSPNEGDILLLEEGHADPHKFGHGDFNLMIIDKFTLLSRECDVVNWKAVKLEKKKMDEHNKLKEAKGLFVDWELNSSQDSMDEPVRDVDGDTVEEDEPMKLDEEEPAKEETPMPVVNRPPAPVRQNIGGSNITPIANITPYVNKWRILGKCTNKSDIRDIKTRNGDMKVFNFDLTDKDGSSIKLACFAEAANRAYSIVQSDCCYYISGGLVKPADKRFNATGHDYELTIRNDTEITPCKDDFALPAFSLKVCPLDRLIHHSGDVVDVLAVVEKIEPVNEFTSKAGKSMTKREVQLIDKSGTIVQLVLWGEQARNFDEASAQQVIGIKGAVVKEWNGGFSLSTLQGSKMELSPNLPDVASLYQWYADKRPDAETKNLVGNNGGGVDVLARDYRSIGCATALQLGNEPTMPTGRYMTIKGYVSNIKQDNALYKSCASESCMKKVVEMNDEYRCEKCNVTGPNFKWTYMLQLEITDYNGIIWVSLFGKNAEKLMKMDANELGALKDDPDAYNKPFQAVRFKNYMWRVRARTETYNEENRLKYSVFDVTEINYDKYIAELAKAADMLEKL